MKKLVILSVILLTLFAVPVQAQKEAPKSAEEEIAALQNQISAMVRARGEDQKQILDLKAEVTKLSAPTPKEAAEQLSKVLESICKTVKAEVDTVTFKFTPERVIDSLTCKK